MARAVWAPSVHNTQPWRFTAYGGQRISLHADADRRLTTADPDDREMMISCGAALFTARLALRSLGYVPVTRVLPDPAQPDLVAQMSWRERAEADEFERRLTSNVLTRRTHRGAFDPEPLPPGTLAALRDAATREGAALRIVADDGRRAALAAAVQTAEYELRRDDERLRELARWTPAPGSIRRDGVPATSYPARAERTQPYFPGRDFARGHGWGVPPLSTAMWYRAAGVAGLLTTTGDRPADWVQAGQALQRILLTASVCGAAVALHSQPLELPWLREFIRTQLSDAACPHLVIRIGLVTQMSCWPTHSGHGVRTVPAAELIPELLPAARQGLLAAGVAAPEADCLLGVIGARVASGQTGAAWQRAALAAAEHDRDRNQALAVMLDRYLSEAATGRPVHTWPA